jgi:2-polyprenyl-3-methyl-5-hydroxy-6-metoxy-1,4-benzoquinol methylase
MGTALLSMRPRYNEDSIGQKGAQWYNHYYKTNVLRYEHYTQHPYYCLYALIADKVIGAQCRSVMEIACGAGIFAAVLFDRDIRQYIGFDFSAEQIRQASMRYSGIKFVCTDVFNTDLFDKTDYDAVVCLEFLEHIERDIDVIRRIRPGARFFGSVPNFPYVSHVRHFIDCQEVASRYASLFDDFRVGWIALNSKGGKLFVFEGRRCSQ